MVIYHMEEGRIFNTFEEFRKPIGEHEIRHIMADFYDYYDPNPLAKARLAHEAFSRYQDVLKAENNCINTVKSADREMKEFLNVYILGFKLCSLQFFVLGPSIRRERYKSGCFHLRHDTQCFETICSQRISRHQNQRRRTKIIGS
jgi:hypothetical protein